MAEIKTKANFERLVKIRIGEPLTAVEIHNNQVLLGSISGYVGCYSLLIKELTYIQEVFEEIIRGIQVDQNGMVQIAVGDHSLVTFPLAELKMKDKIQKTVYQSHQSKKPDQCAQTMVFLSPLNLVMMTASPTQNKEQGDYNESGPRNILHLYQLNNQEWRKCLNFNLPLISVPFDYEGERLVWMEYREGREKRITIYDIQNQWGTEVLTIDKKVEFISHVKLLFNYLIFVQDHKHVKAYNLKETKIYDLFSHSEIVQALYVESTGPPSINQDDYESGNYSKEIQQNQIIVHSIDFNCTYTQYSNNKITHKIPVLKLENVPEQIVKHKYIFDMGYPYYLKVKEGIVAFTNDFGLCVLRL